jgi:hypothetical protein
VPLRRNGRSQGDHRIGCDESLTFQSVDEITRRFVEIERGKLIEDHVEPPDRAGVIILVMADENLLGKASDFFCGSNGMGLGA